MPKVTVTRKQQEWINAMREYYVMLTDVLLMMRHEGVIDEPYYMTEKQIAYAWLGVAEIEPEPVEPWEALKAIYEGKTVRAVDIKDGDVTILKKGSIMNMFDIFHPDSVESFDTKFYILEDE